LRRASALAGGAQHWTGVIEQATGHGSSLRPYMGRKSGLYCRSSKGT
jgi:hypothetical protein